MTKLEAIDAMIAGQKVTHRYFSANEWITIENGKMLLEDGVRCSQTEFWRWRTDESWNDGYSLFKQ